MDKKKFLLLFVFLLFISGIVSAEFQDVAEDNRYREAILYVEREGIVNGYSDNTFRPDQAINRAEFTKIVVGAKFDAVTIETCIQNNVEEESTIVFFPDIPKDAWFAKYICVARENNLVSGYPDGTFLPDATITFVEAAKILVNAFGFSVSADQEIWYRPFVQALAERKAIPREIESFSEVITRGVLAEMIYRLRENITTKLSATYENLSGEIPLDDEGMLKEFNITAKTWEFDPAVITVQKGDQVRIFITSLDVKHGFAIPAFNINEPLQAGTTSQVEFIADQAGTFNFFCSVFCGSGHGSMNGTLIVQE